MKCRDHSSLLLLFEKRSAAENMVDYQFPNKTEDWNNPTNIADRMFPNRNRKLTMKCSPLCWNSYRSVNTTFPQPTLTLFSFHTWLLSIILLLSSLSASCCNVFTLSFSSERMRCQKSRRERKCLQQRKQKARFKRQFEGQSQSRVPCTLQKLYHPNHHQH